MDSMTFGQKLKRELLSRIAKRPEYKRAQLLGMICFCDKRSRSQIGFSTESDGIVAVFSELMSDVLGILPNLTIVQRKGATSICRAEINDPSDILDIYAELFSDDENILRNTENLSREELSYFICGAYLVCGGISDPHKSYRLEFSVSDAASARQLCKILDSCSFSSAVSVRKKQYVVYIKHSESIEDLMTFMGAKLSALELMDIKIYKELRNKTNRQTNCETANIDKTVAAAAAQISDINLIIEKAGIESLPENLQSLALLRLDNPDMSLSELGKKLSQPLSRSGVNHRFEKINEIADKYRKKQSD